MVAPHVKGIDGDWLASLARQSAYSEANAKKPIDPMLRGGSRGGEGGGKGGILVEGGAFGKDVASVEDDTLVPIPKSLTKAQRIELREKKRTQREERRRHAEEARMQRLAGKKRRTTKHHRIDSTVASGRTRKSTKSDGKSTTPSRLGRGEEENGIGGRGKKMRARMTTDSEGALARLSASLEIAIARMGETSVPLSRRGQSSSMRGANDDDDAGRSRWINGLPVEPSGRATRRSTIRYDSREMQPRMRDYNGQGLVRPSMYIPFDDPGFGPRLVLEFEEHVPGFFGRARKKSAKRQADKDMLWRRCLRAKEEGGGVGGKTTMNGRKKAKEGHMGKGMIL